MKKYRFCVSFEKLVIVERETYAEAESEVIGEMINDMAVENTILENELVQRPICLNCGVSLTLDEELEDGKCAQCAK